MTKYFLTDSEVQAIKKLAKKINLKWQMLAARPEEAKSMLAEYAAHGTVNGVKIE